MFSNILISEGEILSLEKYLKHLLWWLQPFLPWGTMPLQSVYQKPELFFPDTSNIPTIR